MDIEAKFTQKIEISNSSKQKILLILEPWAEEYWIEPNIGVEVIGEGGQGCFEIQYSEKGTLLIHAWSGSVARIFLDGKELSPQN